MTRSKTEAAVGAAGYSLIRDNISMLEAASRHYMSGRLNNDQYHEMLKDIVRHGKWDADDLSWLALLIMNGDRISPAAAGSLRRGK